MKEKLEDVLRRNMIDEEAVKDQFSERRLTEEERRKRTVASLRFPKEKLNPDIPNSIFPTPMLTAEQTRSLNILQLLKEKVNN